MPVISATYLLGTLAVQVGSACFNSHRSTKQSQELARKQQEYEELVMREGIENARKEYAELCSLQRQIEIDMQEDRLQMLRDNHLSSLRLEAYRHSMRDWPLLVPPFVIKNECLPLLEFDERQQVTTIPVNCIMTTSMDSKFNLKIFPTLEENLSKFFSKYWRSNGVKSIRFYQQAWRNNMTDVGSKMRDIKAHLKDVPTIVLSPLIKDDKLKFRFYWWGMSGKPEDEHIVDPNNIYDPELSIFVKPGMEYTEEDVKLIVEEATAKVAAFVSYFADLYYWNFYRFAPTLPILAANNDLRLSNFADLYSRQYEQLLDSFLDHNILYADDSLEDIWKSFEPIIANKERVQNKLIEYIKHLPDNLVIEQNAFVKSISQQDVPKDCAMAISLIENRIESIKCTMLQNHINLSVKRYASLSFCGVVKQMLELSRTLPKHDTFNIIVCKDKLAVITFFTSNNEVVSWGKNSIFVYQTKSFIAPNNVFCKKVDSFSCAASKLNDLYILLQNVMTRNEVFEILDEHANKLRKELLPVSSRLEDVFDEFILQVKEELSNQFQSREVEELSRKELRYEDIVKWLRKAKEVMGQQPFDGAFLTRENSGFFDKYPYKLYICLTLSKQPLTEANHPKGVFSFSELDDTIIDMFGKNNSVQLNFN